MKSLGATIGIAGILLGFYTLFCIPMTAWFFPMVVAVILYAVGHSMIVEAEKAEKK